MKKEYYDEQKANYIKEKLSKTSIQKVFHPLIADIMLRRKYEYNLDDKIFTRDLKTFLNNVKTIMIEDMESDTTKRVGEFSPSKRYIAISKSLFEKKDIDYEEIFEILAHETVHAMRCGRKENGRKRDRVFPSNYKHSIVPIGDAFTECEAYDLTYTRERVKIHENVCLKETIGYPHLTPFIDLIAATFRSYKKRVVERKYKRRGKFK